MNYQNLLNSKIKEIKPSGIRRFFDIVAEMDDVISLGVGEPDFPTPAHIRDVGIQSLMDGHTKYTSNAGLMELRKAVAAYYERRFHVAYDGSKQAIITVGGSEALDLCFRVLIEPGDEVLVPEPSFVCYAPLTTISDGVPVPIVTKAEDQFRLTPEALKAAITPKTKLLVLPYPNNPTGAIMRREDLEGIAAVLRGTDIIVISDEIYGELTYGGEQHVSIAEIDGMQERTIIVSGFSKAFSMTGWRLGYAAGPAPLVKVMTKIHQSCIMSAPTTSQYAAITALRQCDDQIEMMRDEYNRRRRYVVKSLNDMGLTCFEPRGAFYVFPSIQISGLTSSEFCEQLLREKEVAIIPGSAFGASGEGYARISYAYSVDHLQTAMKRIREFLHEHGWEK